MTISSVGRTFGFDPIVTGSSPVSSDNFFERFDMRDFVYVLVVLSFIGGLGYLTHTTPICLQTQEILAQTVLYTIPTFLTLFLIYVMIGYRFEIIKLFKHSRFD